MILVPPITVDAAKLTATTVPLDELEWVSGTTYVRGDQRRVGLDLYEVAAADTSADPAQTPEEGAAADPPIWFHVGKVNRFAMFDFVIGNATTGNASIEVEVTPGEIVNTVALFQLQGAQTVRVRVTDPTDGVVYDETRDLNDLTGINNFWSWFFEPYAVAEEALFSDLPSYLQATITITIEGTGDLSVGEVVIGRQYTIGTTLEDTGLGMEDFSVKERGPLGQFSVVEGAFADLGDFDVLLENNQVLIAKRLLRSVRARPALYIGEITQPETHILGFFRTWQTLRDSGTSSVKSLEIEGII